LVRARRIAAVLDSLKPFLSQVVPVEPPLNYMTIAERQSIAERLVVTAFESPQ
jgi:hypothetical protein